MAARLTHGCHGSRRRSAGTTRRSGVGMVLLFSAVPCTDRQNITITHDHTLLLQLMPQCVVNSRHADSDWHCCSHGISTLFWVGW